MPASNDTDSRSSQRCGKLSRAGLVRDGDAADLGRILGPVKSTISREQPLATAAVSLRSDAVPIKTVPRDSSADNLFAS